jgi:DNA-binding MarR family transcriptional regulator
VTKGLRNLYHAVQLFRDLDPELQTQTVVCFLLIAEASEDIHMRDLQSTLNMPSSSTSRNVAALSKFHRTGTPGLDLVEAYEDPKDRRFKRVRLSAKGRALRSRINHFMGV